MRNIFTLIFFMLLQCAVHGQDMNYSFSHSTETYAPIQNALTIAGPANDFTHQRFMVPVGFPFTFCGKVFDTLAVESNGFIKFDESRAVVLFHATACKKDSNNVYSLLSYSIEGPDGNKLFKLQFAGFGYDKNDPSEYLNYQLWLYEQGNKIEIRTGPTSYPGLIDSTGISPMPLIGLINPLQDWNTSALLVTGDASSPGPVPIEAGQGMQYLQFVPPSNKIYTFIPGNN